MKNAKTSRKNGNFVNKFREEYRIFKNKCKIQTFIKVKEEKLFIRLQILSYQRREFHTFFFGINCCSYKTHGFHKVYSFREISLFLFSRKNVKFREKFCEMRPKIFAFYREMFHSLETLVMGHFRHLCSCLLLFFSCSVYWFGLLFYFCLLC